MMIIIRRQFPEKKRRINKYSSEMTQKSTTHKINFSVLPPVMIRKKQAYPRLRKTLLYTYYGLQRRLL